MPVFGNIHNAKKLEIDVIKTVLQELNLLVTRKHFKSYIEDAVAFRGVVPLVHVYDVVCIFCIFGVNNEDVREISSALQNGFEQIYNISNNINNIIDDIDNVLESNQLFNIIQLPDDAQNLITNTSHIAPNKDIIIRERSNEQIPDVNHINAIEDVILAIHGRAGTINKETLTKEKEIAYRSALTNALCAGLSVIKTNGTSTDVVAASIRVMENSPLFNAGRGICFYQ